MTDRASLRNSPLARSSSHLSATSRANTDSPSSSVRPRNRRLISTEDAQEQASTFGSGSGLLSAFSASNSRTGSPLPSGGTSRSAGVSPSRHNPATGDIGQFLSDSFTQSWTSVQGLTSSLFSGAGTPTGKAPPKAGTRGRRLSIGDGRKQNASWGPAPPSSTPGLDDVATGSLAQRQAALKAARTASVLESHDGVNGGLDISGRHKRRNSDEVVAERNQDDDYLVYVHHVQPRDTFVGIILRYKCREDVFRKANGLWSRDSIQTRRWVTIPVAACEARSRPCEAPSWQNEHSVDFLAPTPNAKDDATKAKGAAPHDDYFSPVNGNTEQGEGEDDKPWSHVRWVKIDSIEEPVEIGRVARGAMGYFPPRRKKSIRTISSLSTPRHSFDLPNVVPGSAERPSDRRPSSLSSRPQLSGTPTSTRSRMGSDPMDNRPAWMKRPGGVGSMGRSVKAPGPDRDVFNTWTQKHIPGLNIEGPSMSIMGSETAHFGFRNDTGIAENSHEDGRDSSAHSRQHGSAGGLDRAAAAVETWLRGALPKGPSTPLGRPRARGHDAAGDLIELTDTGSDDGRLADITNNSMSKLSVASTGLHSSKTSIRGRAAGQKRGKDD